MTKKKHLLGLTLTYFGKQIKNEQLLANLCNKEKSPEL
jgi:hypothetical protein